MQVVVKKGDPLVVRVDKSVWGFDIYVDDQRIITNRTEGTNAAPASFVATEYPIESYCRLGVHSISLVLFSRCAWIPDIDRNLGGLPHPVFCRVDHSRFNPIVWPDSHPRPFPTGQNAGWIRLGAGHHIGSVIVRGIRSPWECAESPEVAWTSSKDEWYEYRRIVIDVEVLLG